MRGVGPKNKNETKVVGSFYLQEKKDKVFRAYKLCSFFLVGRNCHQHYDKIYVEDIVKDIPADSPWRGKEIDLKNQLTPYYAHLLEEAPIYNDVLPDHQRFMFIWESNGSILLKKRETAKPLNIYSMEDFRQIISRMPQV